jgi:hypothetical protein
MSYTYTDKVKFAYTNNFDSFGRLRMSQPFTLFDSSHRYKDNGLWATQTVSGGTAVFDANEGLVNLNVTAASGSTIRRETYKVFAYQPGKSLLALNTFVMAPAQSGLTQRVGYYGAANGMFLQLANSTLSLVERSSVTGVLVDTPVAQASWNVDPMDGTGPSGITLDITKAQILFMDFEWLGVGSVRCGFVINGEFHTCHIFHHANIITSTYITTASLPLRYEIFNTAGTVTSSTLKQICSSVISEGGYEMHGVQQAVVTPITTPVSLATGGTYYPIISIRLKTTALDAIAIISALSIMGDGTGKYNWKMLESCTTAGGSWVSAGADSAVEYNITGTGVSGGRTLATGYLSSTIQASVNTDVLKEALFRFQLERDPFIPDPHEICLAVAASTNGETIYGSMDWEEITR